MPKILVVDDALADRALVTGLVAKWMNSTVFEAVDGRDALSKIEIHQPDVVLTDLHAGAGFEDREDHRQSVRIPPHSRAPGGSQRRWGHQRLNFDQQWPRAFHAGENGGSGCRMFVRAHEQA